MINRKCPTANLPATTLHPTLARWDEKGASIPRMNAGNEVQIAEDICAFPLSNNNPNIIEHRQADGRQVKEHTDTQTPYSFRFVGAEFATTGAPARHECCDVNG